MRTQCNSKLLEFEGHRRRRLVAKTLIFLLVFLRVPSWSFVSLRGPSWIFFVLPAPSWIENQRLPALVRNAGYTFRITTTVIPRKKRPQQKRPILVIHPGRTSGGSREWFT